MVVVFGHYAAYLLMYNPSTIMKIHPYFFLFLDASPQGRNHFSSCTTRVIILHSHTVKKHRLRAEIGMEQLPTRCSNHHHHPHHHRNLQCCWNCSKWAGSTEIRFEVVKLKEVTLTSSWLPMNDLILVIVH